MKQSMREQDRASRVTSIASPCEFVYVKIKRRDCFWILILENTKIGIEDGLEFGIIGDNIGANLIPLLLRTLLGDIGGIRSVMLKQCVIAFKQWDYDIT